MDLKDVHQMMKKVQKAGNIHQHLDLIAGLPFEDYETFTHSFDDIYEWKPEQLQLGFLKVLKGSYMYEHAKSMRQYTGQNHLMRCFGRSGFPMKISVT